MEFTQRQQEEHDRYLSALKSQEPEALARVLAVMMVCSLNSTKTKEQLLADVRQSSASIRRNKRIITRNNKIDRLNVLAKKKKLTHSECEEAIKLQQFFKREVQAAAGESV